MFVVWVFVGKIDQSGCLEKRPCLCAWGDALSPETSRRHVRAPPCPPLHSVPGLCLPSRVSSHFSNLTRPAGRAEGEELVEWGGGVTGASMG